MVIPDTDRRELVSVAIIGLFILAMAGLIMAGDDGGPEGVTPETGLASSGPVGGPFDPPFGTYRLRNGVQTSAAFTASTSPPANWLSIRPDSGVLPPGGYVDIVIGFIETADIGQHVAEIVFDWDVLRGDVTLDARVDLDDVPVFCQLVIGRIVDTDLFLAADMSGPDGQPDGSLDAYDVQAFTAAILH